MGTELVAGVVGFILLGLWVDSKFDTGRVGLIVGSILGCVGGFYHFLRKAVRLQKESEAAARQRRAKHSDGDRK